MGSHDRLARDEIASKLTSDIVLTGCATEPGKNDKTIKTRSDAPNKNKAMHAIANSS